MTCMISYRQIPMIVSAIALMTIICAGQNGPAKPKPSPTPAAAIDLQPIRSSPAYAELLLRRTELESNLDALLVDYTEEFPKVKDIRLELGFLKTEMDRLLAVRPADAAKLSQALGQLMLRKVEIETQLDTLRAQYKDDHPDVRKARKKVETYEAAIKDILG
jgi:uncharacterized protein involved in exopolysaccharide biosynthesis